MPNVKINRAGNKVVEYKFPDTISILPISDVHYGAVEHNRKKWEKFLESVLERENVYLVLHGDLINNATRSSVSDIFTETCRPSDQKRKMAEYLYPVKDRILCAVEGNHEFRSGKDVDDDPMEDIMARLGLCDLYSPIDIFLKVGIGYRNKEIGPAGRTEHVYTFMVMHGAGGGATTGASVNRNEKYLTYWEGVDCLISGHTHKPSHTKPVHMIFDSSTGEVRQRVMNQVCTASWMDYGGYPIKKMLPPGCTCEAQEIILKNVDHTREKKMQVLW